MPYSDLIKAQVTSADDARDFTLHRLAHLPRHGIAPGEHDIRGWIVFTEDGQRVGRVCDLIVDVLSLRMRHIEVELDPRLTHPDASRRVVVPIVCARAAAHRKHVNLRGVTSRDIVHAPRYGSSPISREAEAVLECFFVRPRFGSPVPNGAEVDVDAWREQRFWGVRRSGREHEPYLQVTESH